MKPVRQCLLLVVGLAVAGNAAAETYPAPGQRGWSETVALLRGHAIDRDLARTGGASEPATHVAVAPMPGRQQSPMVSASAVAAGLFCDPTLYERAQPRLIPSDSASASASASDARIADAADDK